MSSLLIRYENYVMEEIAIARKLEKLSDDKASEKRARLQFRLADLKKRLIPGTLNKLPLSMQTGGITSQWSEY